MPDEPRWLAVEAVVAINRAVTEASGEAHALTDRAALEIAVRRPWNIWVYFMDRDFATLAAALLAAVHGARAFAAGNERTAYRAALAFLDANGIAVALAGNARAEAQAFEFFAGRLSQRGVVDWFRMWMEPAGS